MASRDGQHVDKLIKQDQLLCYFPQMVFLDGQNYLKYMYLHNLVDFFRRLKPVLQDLRKFVF